MFNSFSREKEEIDKLNEKYHQQSGGKGWVWWMYVIRNGRPVILGNTSSETESRAYLYRNAPNEQGEVVCLNTTDLSSAVRKIKSHILETSHSLDEATIRMVRKQFKSNKPKPVNAEKKDWLDD